MAQYEIKPKPVDAVQWFKEGDHPDAYMGSIGAYAGDRIAVDPGDWIVTDENGRRAVFSPADFADEYQPTAAKPEAVKAAASEIAEKVRDAIGANEHDLETVIAEVLAAHVHLFAKPEPGPATKALSEVLRKVVGQHAPDDEPVCFCSMGDYRYKEVEPSLLRDFLKEQGVDI